MKKTGQMRIAKGACPECHGDLYLDYKYGSRYKCLKCHRYFEPVDYSVPYRKEKRDLS